MSFEILPSKDRYSNTDFYTQCGNSGVFLPKLSLGLWKNFGANQTLEHCREIIYTAFNAGITHFDLANNYGPPPGAAERMLGELLRASFGNNYRDELFISTKAGYEMWDGPYGNWGSRKHLMASVDQSLRRLQLDYVDLFYIHRYDPVTPLEETLQTLVDVVKSGKALYVGISRWPLEATLKGFSFLKANGVPCLCYQGRLNLLDQSPLCEGILDAVIKERCGFVSFSPLAQGLLTDRYLLGIPDDSRMRLEKSLPEEVLTPQLTTRLQLLNRFALERGETLASLALRWVLQHHGVTSVIVGVSRKTQLADLLKCTQGSPLSSEELEILDTILHS